MKFLKGAVIFLLGAGVGASGSYVYFKKKYNEKKTDLDELREHYLGKIEAEQEKEANFKIAKNIIEQNGYVSYDKKIEGVSNMVKDKISEPVVVSPPEDYPDEPIIITETDYSERELTFDKREIDFYMEDKALVNEESELMDMDPIGYENIEEFMNDDSEDTLYIRNASVSSDFMIRKVFGSFSETVGIGGDEDDE